MRNNALYFPYIEVPDDVWTTRVLLYWDKLSSIVPMDYIDKPSKFHGYMASLVHEGLVIQVIPAYYIYRLNDFEENFIRYIEHRISRIRHPRYECKRKLVHVEKLGNLPHWLIENGLAVEYRYPWYKVDSWVADAFMAYLAASLGGIDEVDAAPITNNMRISNLFSRLGANISREREFLLGRLLPIPQEKPSVHSLIKFKEKYGYLLPPLRERIELLSGELGAISDHSQRRARANVVVNELRERLREVESAMKVSWRDIAFGTFMPLLGAGGSFYATEPSQQILAGSAAGLTFASTVYQTINNFRARESALKNNPLAYLAYARQNRFRRT